jgi:hypothetical protein
MVRLSVGLLLIRISQTRAHKITIWIITGLMLATSISFFFVTMFQCRPISYFWNWSPTAVGKCGRHTVLANVGYAHMTVSFIADWTLGLLPIWLLRDVPIDGKTKAGIAVLLGFGLLAGVAALARIPFIKQLLDTSKFFEDWIGLSVWYDFSFRPETIVTDMTSSIIEPGIGLLATSMAAFRVVFASEKWQSVTSKMSSRARLWSRGSKVETQESSAAMEKTLEQDGQKSHPGRALSFEDMWGSSREA